MSVKLIKRIMKLTYNKLIINEPFAISTQTNMLPSDKMMLEPNKP